MPLHRFVAGGNTYTFPSTLGSYSDNFGDTVTRTTRLPGVDGGFDEYLAEAAAREIGSIRQAFTLASDDQAGLDALKDGVRAMLQWGKGYLYFRPSNYPTQVERRVWARISNILMAKDEGDARTLYWQRATVIFQASLPIWEDVDTNDLDIVHSGTQTDGNLNNLGNAIALPVITVVTGGSDVLTNPWYIRVMDGTEIIDEITYNYDIPNDITLTFDCLAKSVDWYDGVDHLDGYDATMDFEHPDWIRLRPGNNTIRVVSADGGDAGNINVEWRHAWY